MSHKIGIALAHLRQNITRRQELQKAIYPRQNLRRRQRGGVEGGRLPGQHQQQQREPSSDNAENTETIATALGTLSSSTSQFISETEPSSEVNKKYKEMLEQKNDLYEKRKMQDFPLHRRKLFPEKKVADQGVAPSIGSSRRDNNVQERGGRGRRRDGINVIQRLRERMGEPSLRSARLEREEMQFEDSNEKDDYGSSIRSSVQPFPARDNLLKTMFRKRRKLSSPKRLSGEKQKRLNTLSNTGLMNELMKPPETVSASKYNKVVPVDTADAAAKNLSNTSEEVQRENGNPWAMGKAEVRDPYSDDPDATMSKLRQYVHSKNDSIQDNKKEDSATVNVAAAATSGSIFSSPFDVELISKHIHTFADDLCTFVFEGGDPTGDFQHKKRKLVSGSLGTSTLQLLPESDWYGVSSSSSGALTPARRTPEAAEMECGMVGYYQRQKNSVSNGMGGSVRGAGEKIGAFARGGRRNNKKTRLPCAPFLRYDVHICEKRKAGATHPHPLFHRTWETIAITDIDNHHSSLLERNLKKMLQERRLPDDQFLTFRLHRLPDASLTHSGGSSAAQLSMHEAIKELSSLGAHVLLSDDLKNIKKIVKDEDSVVVNKKEEGEKGDIENTVQNLMTRFSYHSPLDPQACSTQLCSFNCTHLSDTQVHKIFSSICNVVNVRPDSPIRVQLEGFRYAPCDLTSSTTTKYHLLLRNLYGRPLDLFSRIKRTLSAQQRRSFIDEDGDENDHIGNSDINLHNGRFLNFFGVRKFGLTTFKSFHVADSLSRGRYLEAMLMMAQSLAESDPEFRSLYNKYQSVRREERLVEDQYCPVVSEEGEEGRSMVRDIAEINGRVQSLPVLLDRQTPMRNQKERKESEESSTAQEKEKAEKNSSTHVFSPLQSRAPWLVPLLNLLHAEIRQERKYKDLYNKTVPLSVQLWHATSIPCVEWNIALSVRRALWIHQQNSLLLPTSELRSTGEDVRSGAGAMMAMPGVGDLTIRRVPEWSLWPPSPFDLRTELLPPRNFSTISLSSQKLPLKNSQAYQNGLDSETSERNENQGEESSSTTVPSSSLSPQEHKEEVRKRLPLSEATLASHRPHVIISLRDAERYLPEEVYLPLCIRRISKEEEEEASNVGSTSHVPSLFLPPATRLVHKYSPFTLREGWIKAVMKNWLDRNPLPPMAGTRASAAFAPATWKEVENVAVGESVAYRPVISKPLRSYFYLVRESIGQVEMLSLRNDAAVSSQRSTITSMSQPSHRHEKKENTSQIEERIGRKDRNMAMRSALSRGIALEDRLSPPLNRLSLFPSTLFTTGATSRKNSQNFIAEKQKFAKGRNNNNNNNYNNSDLKEGSFSALISLELACGSYLSCALREGFMIGARRQSESFLNTTRRTPVKEQGNFETQRVTDPFKQQQQQQQRQTQFEKRGEKNVPDMMRSSADTNGNIMGLKVRNYDLREAVRRGIISDTRHSQK